MGDWISVVLSDTTPSPLPSTRASTGDATPSSSQRRPAAATPQRSGNLDQEQVLPTTMIRLPEKSIRPTSGPAIAAHTSGANISAPQTPATRIPYRPRATQPKTPSTVIDTSEVIIAKPQPPRVIDAQEEKKMRASVANGGTTMDIQVYRLAPKTTAQSRLSKRKTSDGAEDDYSVIKKTNPQPSKAIDAQDERSMHSSMSKGGTKMELRVYKTFQYADFTDKNKNKRKT